jgi:predicted nucleic acid-binding protein
MLLEKCKLRSQLLGFSINNIMLVPLQVMEEYANGNIVDPKLDLSVFQEIFKPISLELDNELLPFFNNDSTSGEIWVISYARQHPEFYCVIDEQFARNVCNVLGVNVIGTIGIINEMKNCGLLTPKELEAIRSAIKNSKFYLSREMLKKLDLVCNP